MKYLLVLVANLIVSFTFFIVGLQMTSKDIAVVLNKQETLRHEIKTLIKEENESLLKEDVKTAIADSVLKNKDIIMTLKSNILTPIASRLNIVDKYQDKIDQRLKMVDKTQLQMIKRLTLVDRTQNKIIQQVTTNSKSINVQSTVIRSLAGQRPPVFQ